MSAKDSLSIINDFLKINQVNIDPKTYLKGYIVIESDTIGLPDDIIGMVIGDAYGSANDIVKIISDELVKQYDIYLGRIQKDQLKRYIDYNFENDFEILLNLLKQDIHERCDLKSVITNTVIWSKFDRKYAVKTFLENLQDAIDSKNNSRVQDYLLFLYSRLISLNENRKLSLYDLFLQNQHIMRKELSISNFEQIENLCKDTHRKSRFESITTFNENYIKILEKNGEKHNKSGIIYLNVNQMLFNKFGSKTKFFDYLFNFVKVAYSKIQNHKTLAIKIENIFDNEINIKWELYAYLTIYAEKFLRQNERRDYYKPEESCIDVLENKFGITLTEYEKEILACYYSEEKNKSFIKLPSKLNSPEVIEIIDFFKQINHGFTFIDCYILQTNNQPQNSKEISFIKNENEILLIFFKHEFDDRKIPCPVCGGLKISGNSYSEIGIKSWECKNPLCSERSKTNRGKRYSEKTILMQNAAFDFSYENQIPKDLTKIWRKDYVGKWELDNLYIMLIKYFSFVGDKITAVNCEDTTLFEGRILIEKRIPELLTPEEFLLSEQIESGIHEAFMNNNNFFDMFIYDNEEPSEEIGQLDIEQNKEKVKIINGDCHKVLQAIGLNMVHHMVTSPPYYNAREYSQWKNLFSYLNDIYNIVKKSHDTLVKGGVFFYNVGDIFDNENIVVKSTMGEKRIPLGAYTILLFQKAGFDLLDNIIWYKGEPQSNRHKNDGNYTPYYQRPANCYEHIFIFKKKGDLRTNVDKSKNQLISNLVKFSPVIKIGKGGVNNYGHTAPFPSIIPTLSITCFTNNGEFVLDPFSGSGTSAIIANLLNRCGIGIELNEDYAKLSIEKIKSEYLDSDFIIFDEKDKVLEYSSISLYETLLF
jgi:DNA modification methylase